MMRRTSHGFMLVLSLIIISLSMFMINYLVDKSSVFARYSRASYDREQAELLALSGLELAKSQLANADNVPQEKGAPGDQKKSEPTENPRAQAQQLLKTLLPNLGYWQTFGFNEKDHGIDGSIKFCVTSEQGKIDLNTIFDFSKKKFVLEETNNPGNIKKCLQDLFARIQKSLGGNDLFAAFEKFLKTKTSDFHDVTELLLMPEFSSLANIAIFFNPDDAQSTAKDEAARVYLADIFTVWSGEYTMNPWLFSPSTQRLLGLKALEGKTVKDRSAKIDPIIKKFKSTLSWPQDWDSTFKELYGKNFASLPKDISTFFATNFETSMFSVLSYGTVGTVTQKVLAIIKRSSSESQDKKKKVTLEIKRIYWL